MADTGQKNLAVEELVYSMETMKTVLQVHLFIVMLVNRKAVSGAGLINHHVFEELF